MDYSTCFLEFWKIIYHLDFNLLRQFTNFLFVLLHFSYPSWKDLTIFLWKRVLPCYIFCYITCVNIAFLLSSQNHDDGKFYRMSLSLISTFLRFLAKILLWPLRNIFTISSFHQILCAWNPGKGLIISEKQHDFQCSSGVMLLVF